MSALKLAAILMMLSAVAAHAAPPQRIDGATPIRIDGIGAIRIGMTLLEAKRVTGMAFTDPDKYQASDDTKACAFVDVVGGQLEMSFMVLEGKIARIDVGEKATNRTVEGLGIGASEADIRRIYKGDKITVAPAFYGGDDWGREYTVEMPGRGQMRYFFLYRTDLKQLNGMRIGRKDAVELVEGCL